MLYGRRRVKDATTRNIRWEPLLAERYTAALASHPDMQVEEQVSALLTKVMSRVNGGAGGVVCSGVSSTGGGLGSTSVLCETGTTTNYFWRAETRPSSPGANQRTLN